MTLKLLFTKINNKLLQYSKNYFFNKRNIGSAVILNLNSTVSNNQQRALICYLTDPYFITLENISRTISYEILKIVKVFSELGYCIDIIGCNNVRSIEYIKTRNYDLIFGFGETFFKVTRLQPDVRSILYMTENHPNFSFEEEKKRNEYFYARHGRKPRLSRSGNFYKKEHLEFRYSDIITLSDTEPLKPQYGRPYSIFPTGIINYNYTFKNKNHQSAKTNFLWLGSYGAIHKGLDLLIDIFKKRDDIVLHICGFTKEDRNVLKIPHRENIIEYGHINIRSDLFLSIVEKCSYIILPSCSEACSTSITTGMLHGLIPIVIRNSGFNKLGDNAIFLDDYKIEYLDAKLTEFANYSIDELAKLSKRVFDFAHNNFSISVFEANFRSIILEILMNS
jgi:hypothetical protein